MRFLLLFILFLTTVSEACSQDVLIEQTTENVLKESEFGPNKKYYQHQYLSFGIPLVLDPVGEVTAVPFRSFSFEVGSRVKLKLNTTFSLGLDWGVSLEQYTIQSSKESLYEPLFGEKVPDSLDREQLKLVPIHFAPYFRINFGQRGDHLGNYFDLAFRTEWRAGTWYSLRYNTPNSDQFKKIKTAFRGLKALERFQLYPELRFGHSVYNFYVRYSLLDALNQSALQNAKIQLPAWRVGVALNVPN